MRRLSILLLSSLAAIALYACGGAPTQASSASDETCPLVSAGPPPVCPGGCYWNGKTCRKVNGVIMEGAGSDAGTPKPPQ